jgi:hypothetical protein
MRDLAIESPAIRGRATYLAQKLKYTPRRRYGEP